MEALPVQNCLFIYSGLTVLMHFWSGGRGNRALPGTGGAIGSAIGIPGAEIGKAAGLAIPAGGDPAVLRIEPCFRRTYTSSGLKYSLPTLP